jgi:hypothetical protein
VAYADQQLRGGSPGAAGVALLPLTASSIAGPIAAYRPLSRRFGHTALLPAGLGSGLQNTTRQSGALLAVSVVGSMLGTTGHLVVPFAVLGAGDLTGVALGLAALRAQATKRAGVPMAQTELSSRSGKRQPAVPQFLRWTTHIHRRQRFCLTLTGR